MKWNDVSKSLKSIGSLRFSKFYTFSIIALDEVDHLKSRNHAMLYSAFEWPYKCGGKVICIGRLRSNRLASKRLGIANSLDLTERLLPKLKLVGEPVVVVFEPYTKQQLIRILEHKLSEVSFSICLLCSD